MHWGALVQHGTAILIDSQLISRTMLEFAAAEQPNSPCLAKTYPESWATMKGLQDKTKTQFSEVAPLNPCINQTQCVAIHVILLCHLFGFQIFYTEILLCDFRPSCTKAPFFPPPLSYLLVGSKCHRFEEAHLARTALKFKNFLENKSPSHARSHPSICWFLASKIAVWGTWLDQQRPIKQKKNLPPGAHCKFGKSDSKGCPNPLSCAKLDVERPPAVWGWQEAEQHTKQSE